MGARADHGVIGFGRTQDPGLQGDFLSLQSLGVARTIEPLVVVEDDSEDFTQAAQRPEEGLGGLGGGLLHLGPLLLHQGLGPAQQVLLAIQGPDVVQEGGQLQDSLPLAGQAHGPGHPPGQIGHAPGMSRKMGVPLFQGLGQQTDDRREVPPLLLQPLGVAALQAKGFQAAPHALHELPVVERLHQVIVDTQLDGLDGNIGAGVAGDHDGTGIRLLLFEVGEGLDPIHLGHPDVADHQIEVLTAGRLDGLLAGGGRGDLVAFVQQQDLQGSQHQRVVLDHQDLLGQAS